MHLTDCIRHSTGWAWRCVIALALAGLAVALVGGGGCSRTVRIEPDDAEHKLTFGWVRFAGRRGLRVGRSPRFALVVDMDGDGNLDLVVVEEGENAVGVCLGDGQRFFAECVNASSQGSQPIHAATADFDDDGYQDVVVLNVGATGKVAVLFGDGSGGFRDEPGAVADLTGTDPRQVAAGDLDGDGLPDLVVANEPDGKLTVYLSDEDEPGTFDAEAATELGLDEGEIPISVTTERIDGTRSLDLLVLVDAGAGEEGRLLVLLNDGAGGLTLYGEGDPALIGEDPVGMAVGSFDEDEHLDVVVASGEGEAVTLAVGDGEGGFLSSGVVIELEGVPAGLAAGELDGLRAGGLDVAVVLSEEESVHAYSGAGDGTFAELSSAVAESRAIAVVAQDLDNDGLADLLIGSEQTARPCVSVYFNTGGGQFELPAIELPATPRSLVSADIDDDGNLDMVLAADGEFVVLVANEGGGVFDAQELEEDPDGASLSVGEGQTALCVAYLDGDKHLDLAVAIDTEEGEGIQVLLGQGDRAFLLGERVELEGIDPASLVVADFNEDGDSDLLVGGSSSIKMFLGDGDGTFDGEDPFERAMGDGGPLTVAVGDVNDDGHEDVAVAKRGSSKVTFLLGDGAGGFSGGDTDLLSVDLSPCSITVADFDGDGLLDAATANAGAGKNNVSVLLNDGEGGYQAAITFEAGRTPLAITTADLGDGLASIITANSDSSSVAILLWDEKDATFEEPAQQFGTGRQPASLAVGDFDDDGTTDIAVGNVFDETITILSNVSR